MQPSSMPFKILALAPFRIKQDTPWDGPPVVVDRLSLNDAVSEMDVYACIPVPENLCPAGGVEFRCQKLKDFHPDGLIQNISFLNHLMGARQFLSEAAIKKLSGPELEKGLRQWPDLPEIKCLSVKPGSLKTASSEKKSPDTSTNTALDNILDMVAVPDRSADSVASSSSSSSLPSGIEQIDAIAEKVLGIIFEDEGFRAAEAAWRGLKLLLEQALPAADDVVVEIVPVNLNDLESTLASLTPGLIENLPSLIIIDLLFDSSAYCLSLLEKIANFSETLMVPAMVGVSSGFMHLQSWSDLKRLAFIPHHLEQPEYAKWQALKKQHAAGWVAACCNRFLIRYPYGKDNPLRKLAFSEASLPWVNSPWAVAALIVKSFTETGWPTRFTQWQNFKIEDLALHSHEGAGQIPVEVIFDSDRSDQLIRAGMMPLAAILNKDISFVPAETTIAGISLARQFFVSRITQFILRCKDVFPKDLNGAELEELITAAFGLLWENSGQAGAEKLEIIAGQPDSDNRIPLHIELRPSRKILPRGDDIIMDFFW